jgi:hypothetical protein
MADILKYPVYEDELISFFADAIHDNELKYNCKDLYYAGIENDNELGDAILKSIQVIKQAGLLPHHHFKHMYVTELDTGNTYNDWRISRMGFLLILMHATGNSPVLNKWKIEMIKLIK